MGPAIHLRHSRSDDLAFVTSLERHADNRDLIGQWTDGQHLAAIVGKDRWGHWIIERDGTPAGYLIARDCREQGAGIYVKRILVAEKERGTGQAAMRAFLRLAFERGNAACVWLNVRHGNARAEAVYRKLGFERFEPDAGERRVYDSVAEAPAERAFRMRLRRPGGDAGIAALAALEDRIARSIEEARVSGELARAKGYGEPLPAIAGWDETPEALRMPMKILRDAGVPPPEIEMFHERARLRSRIEACADPEERNVLLRQLSDLEQKISLRLESLRINARL